MDRISQLPDELLIHILSFLDTKHAVATSILSSRWIRLWKSVPVLNFDFHDSVRYYIDRDDSLYPDEENYMERCRRIKCQRGKRERRFLGLVEKVLLLNRCPNISLFRLRFSNAYHDYTDEIGEWVQCAFARNVVEVDIYAPEHGCSEDRCLRIGPCHTLEILRIDVDFDILLVGPSLVSFPNLKELHLKFRYDGLGSLARLFTGLPRLQVLWLSVESVIVDDATDLPSERRDLRFNFSGTALKSVYFDWLEQFNGIRYLNIVIDAPNLEYLHLQNNFAATYMIKNQPAISEVLLGTELVEGGVSNNGLGDDFDYAAGDFSYQSIIGILQVICNTNVLSIHECIMMALIRSGPNKLPMFHSLTKLTLDLHCSSWNLFLHFLHSCPNLKSLILEEGYMADDDIEGLVSWSQPESVPTCLLFHLKELGMKGLRNQLKEKVVTYIEKNAKVLEKITIEPYSSF